MDQLINILGVYIGDREMVIMDWHVEMSQCLSTNSLFFQNVDD
jgi:hypothetical protein